jgi:hypothetical protein
MVLACIDIRHINWERLAVKPFRLATEGDIVDWLRFGAIIGKTAVQPQQ